MNNEKAMAVLYDSHEQAEQAVKQLQKCGYDMKKLSIIGKDYHTQETKKRSIIGAFWGNIWSILFGAAFLFIPKVGFLLIAGPFVASLAGVSKNALVLGGMNKMEIALANLGIPKEAILEYEAEVRAGKFMLLAYGTQTGVEVEVAKQILGVTSKIERL